VQAGAQHAAELHNLSAQVVHVAQTSPRAKTQLRRVCFAAKALDGKFGAAAIEHGLAVTFFRERRGRGGTSQLSHASLQKRDANAPFAR